MVINHLLSGMILQVWAKSTKAKTITYLPGTRNKTSRVELKSRKFELVTIVSKLIFFVFCPHQGITIYSKGDSNPYTTQLLCSSRTSQQTCILVGQVLARKRTAFESVKWRKIIFRTSWPISGSMLNFQEAVFFMIKFIPNLQPFKKNWLVVSTHLKNISQI